MANPINQTNTTIPETTYNKLKQIKEQRNCTFDEILVELCKLDLKYNYIEHTQKYELYYRDAIFHFEIIFRKQDMVFKYLTSYGKETSKISEWGIPDRVRNQFYEFIHEDHCRIFFEEMPFGIMFKDFDIYKAG